MKIRRHYFVSMTTQRRQGEVCRLYTTGLQLDVHMEKLAFSSIDALSAGALTMERKTAHMENIMTLAHNDKEDVTLTTLISGPPTF